MANGKVSPQAQPMVDEEFGAAGAPADLVSKGKTLMKVQTPFVTAISVQKPRDMDAVVKAIEKEAEYAGEKFWYRLPFGEQKVEGPTIGLATSLLREWGNNALTMEVQETDDAFLFFPRYIDLEKGSQIERAFRQRKSQRAGRMESERAIDIAFQIGQSKAIRNVIVNALPKWLVARAIAKAKATVAAGITPAKLEEAKKAVVTFFEGYGVTVDQLVAYAGRARAEWSSEDIADFKAAKEALVNKETSIDELFPKETKAPEGPITGKAIADALAPTKPAQEATGSSGPSPEEQERIKQREIVQSKAHQCAKCELFGSDTLEELRAHIAKAHPDTQKASPAPTPSKGPEQKPKGSDLFGK